MMPDRPIVTVDVSRTLAPAPGPFTVRYAILTNPTAAEVEAYATAHPDVYVFTFATRTVEECPDYSALDPPTEPDVLAPAWQTRVVQPFYVGNLNPEVAIREFISLALGIADATESGSPWTST